MSGGGGSEREVGESLPRKGKIQEKKKSELDQRGKFRPNSEDPLPGKELRRRSEKGEWFSDREKLFSYAASAGETFWEGAGRGEGPGRKKSHPASGGGEKFGGKKGGGRGS